MSDASPHDHVDAHDTHSDAAEPTAWREVDDRVPASYGVTLTTTIPRGGVGVDGEAGVRRPLVVLLGWIGAEGAQMRKYTALYNAMGYATTATTAPAWAIFSPWGATLRSFTLRLFRCVRERYGAFCDGGIVLHLFSNGGAFCLAWLYICERDGVDRDVVTWLKRRVCAVVFDSAPCYMHRDASALALSLGLAAGNDRGMSVIQHTYKVVKNALDWVTTDSSPHVFWHCMTYHPPWAPEYYIFSTADPLLDADRLQRLVDTRKQMDAHPQHAIRSTKVDHADHVKIIKSHPDLYVGIMQSVNEWGVNRWREQQQSPPLPPWKFDRSLHATSSSSKL